MLGKNNYVFILNGGIVSGCMAKQNAGCFYLGGTLINQVKLISGDKGESSIGSV